LHRFELKFFVNVRKERGNDNVIVVSQKDTCVKEPPDRARFTDQQ